MTMDRFAPFVQQATRLLALCAPSTDDGAHDLSHLQRVWANVLLLQREEGGDLELLLAAVLLHDCVAVEKDSPLRANASRLSAERAAGVLTSLGWRDERIAAACHAIEAHSFSAAIAPTSLEARILQDADRLDAIGLIGVVRCFHVSGRMGSALYDADDIDALHRPLDDQRFALDHFRTKLLGLASGFQTAAGARLAEQRHARMVTFLDAFREEIQPPLTLIEE
ncbi:HD domain-containing protein [Pseudomonas sp. MM211]|uniref:HD domain-containing protein n=1 Tax=Pseudomonas sp. MM211 TaxID=2866808 RepID=UPI001CEC6CBB|nr:HD domain-containing protein [Pseudomonas sp. MM211]UCJ17769.1 HD domain-containing protein [Pseudomonas sp. MM211]